MKARLTMFAGEDLKRSCDPLIEIYNQLRYYERILEDIKGETRETLVRLIRRAREIIIESRESLYGLLHQIAALLTITYFENFYKE